MSYYEIEIKLSAGQSDPTPLSILTGAEAGTKLQDLLDANRDSILGHLKTKIVVAHTQGTERAHRQRFHKDLNIDEGALYVSNKTGSKLLPSFLITQAQTLYINTEDDTTVYHDPLFSKGLFGTSR